MSRHGAAHASIGHPLRAFVRRGVLVCLLAAVAACDSAGTMSPAGPSPVEVTVVTPPPPAAFPPLAGPSLTYEFDRGLAPHVWPYTTTSRFVLYDNGAFVLRYQNGGEFRGGYTAANGVLTFEWEGWSAAGPWGATGTLAGDTLTVRYNLVMQLTDFDDAVYVRVP